MNFITLSACALIYGWVPLQVCSCNWTTNLQSTVHIVYLELGYGVIMQHFQHAMRDLTGTFQSRFYLQLTSEQIWLLWFFLSPLMVQRMLSQLATDTWGYFGFSWLFVPVPSSVVNALYLFESTVYIILLILLQISPTSCKLKYLIYVEFHGCSILYVVDMNVAKALPLAFSEQYNIASKRM